MISRKGSELFLLLVALTVILCGLTFGTSWKHLKLSLLTQQTLRRPFAMWTPFQVLLPFSIANETSSVTCNSAIAEINALDPKRSSSESLHRLVRIISLSCENDESVARRFQTENAAGQKLNGLDALYVGEALRRLGRYQDALELQRRVPEISLRYIEQGRIAIELMNDEPRGLAYFDLATSIDATYRPQKVSMYMYQCLIILRDAGRSWGYIPCENFLRAVPDAALPNLLLGRSYLLRGNSEVAQKYIRNAIRLDPKMGDAYYWLGRSLISATDIAGAKNAFDEGLAQAATYPWNYLARAELAVADGDEPLAIQLLCHLMQLPGADAVAAAQRLFETMGRPEDEVRCDP